MMTTMAALLGGLPLALGSGTGAELRRPLGITIVGGLLLSQLLTLYTTPVVYLWFDRLAQRFRGTRSAIGNPIPHDELGDVRLGLRLLDHEYFGPIYPASDWHVAAGGGVAAVGNSRVQFSSGGIAAEGGFSGDRRSGCPLPGADPQTMASAVATPLERQFGRISAVNQMTSSSQLGTTGITLQFDLNRNIDAAARDVQAAINAARSQLQPTCRAIQVTARRTRRTRRF
jgi:hypothetical protein